MVEQRPDPPRAGSPLQKQGDAEPRPMDDVDEASMDSFPASDPPSWNSLAAGPPDRHEQVPPPGMNQDNPREAAAAVDDVDEASMDSFPASDPPSWNSLAAGPPERVDQQAALPPQGDAAERAAIPAEASQRPYTVIYDSNCRTCLRLADVLRRWDRQSQVWVIASSDARIPDLFPWIPQSAYERALQMIGPDRTTTEGAAAIEKLLDILPGGTPLARLFSIPLMGRLLDRGYRWFARNRRNFGCGDHCTISLEPPTTQ